MVVDPRPSHASFYQGCDYLTPNWKEALGLLPTTLHEKMKRLGLLRREYGSGLMQELTEDHAAS